ncbi:MAG: DUF3450 family protein [Polyangia bacterium]
MKTSGKSRHKARRPSAAIHPLSLVAVPCIAALLLSLTARGQSTVEMAEQIAELRTDVEDLAAEIEAQKENQRGQLRSYAAQKADLEMEIQRAEMNLEQLRGAKARRIEEVERDQRRDELFEPVVLKMIARIKSTVMAGLPFQLEQRAKDLDELKRRIDEGLIKSTEGVARLWDRVEDELRLSRENGIYKQVIRVGGDEMLAEVARVGMVMLYFETRDGRFGHTVREDDGGWRYEIVSSEDGKKQIANLFDSFKKQIRAGFFLLPNALPPGGEQ